MALKAPTPTKRAATRRTPAEGSRSGSPTTRKAAAHVTVKGAAASSQQISVINGCLTEARSLGASRRVMIALVMCITQESAAGAEMAQTGDDDTGIYQQGRPWVSVAGAKQPGPSTKAFLVTGPTSWKKRHGSLKNAPSPLYEAIHKVQGNKTASDYAPWEAEATRTVDAWIGSNGGISGGVAGSLDVGLSVPVAYLFKRGEKGEPKDSWETSGDLGEEVQFSRWAALNTLHFVSDRELRQAESQIEINGTEAWLVTRPSWSLSGRQAVSECTFTVLSERWAVLPGAVVTLARRLGPLAGRWLVRDSRDDLRSPETEVTLARPRPVKAEPAHEVRTVTPAGDTGTTLVGADGEGASGAAPSGSPKNIIDTIVLPIGRENGVARTVAQNDAGNASHGPTKGGSGSDHQGPPTVAWAADMGIGQDIRGGGNPGGAAKGDKLARALARRFDIPWSGSGFGNATHGGYRFQVIWRIDTPQAGNHFTHVHFGVRKV